MSRKSRYQLVNRGRKDRPAWYLTNSVDGSNEFIGGRRFAADGRLRLAREFEPIERKREDLVAQGYHLPGLIEIDGGAA